MPNKLPRLYLTESSRNSGTGMVEHGEHECEIKRSFSEIQDSLDLIYSRSGRSSSSLSPSRSSMPGLSPIIPPSALMSMPGGMMGDKPGMDDLEGDSDDEDLL